ncbi:MAG: aminoacyl--tRNA ligase-related protein [bacterium]|nr:aminoacyl--tRNA ligase-related protein [bacterium]
MLQSKIFSKTLKNAPSDEKSQNAILLIRAGFIDKLSAGIYSYLPLGLKVIKKIENIIREEMEKIGAQEILMPALHSKENWEKTGRWGIKEMFKVEDKYGLGWTHEEIITPLMKNFINNVSKLNDLAVYQIQTKFRNEPRAKSGILRTKEFIMKDLYSFHCEGSDSLENYYEKIKNVYWDIFERLKIKEKTYLTLASGGSFSKESHEFQTVTPAGEDLIYVCENCGAAINEEIKGNHNECPRCGEKRFKEEKAIEVGNIFQLHRKYSEVFGLVDSDGKPIEMGCYGMGVSRVMGAIAEIHNDEKGLIWPTSVAPFVFHILALDSSEEIKKSAQKIYNELSLIKKEALFDDRENKSAGEKLVDSDLLGIPYKIIVSKRNMEKGVVEIKDRQKGTVKFLKPMELNKFYKSKICLKNY